MPLFPDNAGLMSLLGRLPAALQAPGQLWPLFQAFWAKVRHVEEALKQQGIPWPPPIIRDLVALTKAWEDERRFLAELEKHAAAAWDLGVKAGYVSGTFNAAAIAADPRFVDLVRRKAPMFGRMMGTYIAVAESLGPRINHNDKQIDEATGGALPTAAAILADWQARGVNP